MALAWEKNGLSGILLDPRYRVIDTRHMSKSQPRCMMWFSCLLVVVFAADAQAVVIQWSPVGNAGNSNDSATGNLYGGVGYNYNIGTYDVTNSQYVEFLNAKDPTGLSPLHLYDFGMSDPTYGGITYTSGAASGSKYSVMSGHGNHPVNWVTWYDTIRFANWLNNGQGSGDTESGAYTLLGGTARPSNGLSITRNAGATVFLPSENEWYKAAYNVPGTSSYNLYPTSSSLAPTASLPTGLANHANYDGVVGNLTDVGAYSGTTSPYGAFDMGGNVYQWNEALVDSGFIFIRRARGGSFNFSSANLLSSAHSGGAESISGDWIGFRVASVANIPEPSTGVLAVIASGMLWWWRKRFK